jgi:DMSO/TMAO reductase YedYZ heme-binding membrane subunit
MRTSGQLFRWGLTSLLLAPLAFLSAWVAGGQLAFAWLGFILILLGGALNAAAIVRGVQRIGSGALLADLDGVDLSQVGPNAPRPLPTEPIVPRQRIIFPPEAEPTPPPGLRRRVGLGAAAALLGFIAFGAYTLAVEQPLAIAQQQLTLDEVYAAWGTASRIAFTIGMIIWVVLSLAVVTGVAVLALVPSLSADRLITARRMLATACIAGSVIVTAAFFPYFSLGISLPDDLPFFATGVLSPGSLLFGLTGIALSAVAILLTVPSWRRSRS